MKLAEALILRAERMKKAEQLKQRLKRNAMIQEGDKPSEEPHKMMAELDNVLSELTALIKKINNTNMLTKLDDGRTLTNALAERDAISMKRGIMSELIEAASIRVERYSNSEVKYLSTVNVPQLQNRWTIFPGIIVSWTPKSRR